MPEREEMLTPEEVADWLKVSYATALRLIKKGELPSVQVGRQYRVPASEVMKMVGAPDTLHCDRDGWQQPSNTTDGDSEEWREAIREVAEAEEVFTPYAVRFAEAGANAGGSLPDVVKEAREEVRAWKLPEDEAAQVAEQVECLLQCAANILRDREE